MSSTLEYKGYIWSIDYSAEDELLHGKLIGIRDLVAYEGTDVRSLKESFQEAVDDYLKSCRHRGKTPDVPFKGSFNVRVGPELHKRAAAIAGQKHKTLNTVVSEALESYIAAEEKKS